MTRPDHYWFSYQVRRHIRYDGSLTASGVPVVFSEYPTDDPYYSRTYFTHLFYRRIR